MNWILQSNGLSARRRSIEKNKKDIFSVDQPVKQRIFLAFIVGMVIAVSSCNKKADSEKLTQVKKDHAAVATDSLDKPKVNIKVNKHYDDKGNLVGFDSTYSSFYSNVKGDTLKMDSLMHSFDKYFNRNHSSLFDRQFNTLFFQDSTRYPDFFHDDFFMKRYELNDEYLRGVMRHMDSIKNDFFKDHSKKEKDTKYL